MSDKNITWAIFYSGGGRCANDCLELFINQQLKYHHIDCVITSGQETDKLENFKKHNIAIIDRNPKEFPSIEEYQHWLAQTLLARNIDYIFLLGYKYRIRKELLNVFENRILNIHPSLLPSFKNTQSAIQDAMQMGVRISGVTTHIIDNKIDEGFIVDQEAVKLSPNKSFEKLDLDFNKAGKKLIKRTFDFIGKNHKPKWYLEKYLEQIKYAVNFIFLAFI